MKARRRFAAYTLVELLLAVGIIAVLAVVVVVIIKPGAFFQQSRDSRRIVDLNTLLKTLYLFQSDVGVGATGLANTVYISLPDATATSTQGTQCASLGLPLLPPGWTYHCAGPSYYKRVDGTGWLPLNLTLLSSGPLFEKLATDPVNDGVRGFYYAYTTDGGTSYELTSSVESHKYGLGGSEDKTSTDHGMYPDLYEVGVSYALAPIDYANGSGAGTGNYTFGGFQSPLQADGRGIYNLGRTLPVKFELTDAAGNYVTSATAHLIITKVQNGIVGTTPVELFQSTTDTGNLFHITGNQYHFNLNTDDLGTGTWQLKAVIDDGSSHTTFISLSPN